MLVIFVKNGLGGPFTIHSLNGVYFPVSLKGNYINPALTADSESQCVGLLQTKFGFENIDVQRYDNSKDGLWAMYSFLTKPLMIQKITNYRVIGFSWGFGIAYWKDNYTQAFGARCYMHNILLPFCKISIGQFK